MRNFISIDINFRCKLTILISFLLFPNVGIAQDVDFQIRNLSLEQIVVNDQNLLDPTRTASASAVSTSPSSSIILQGGVDNSANFFTDSAPGNATVSYQLGSANISQGVIIESPNSTIAQFQLGEANSSDVAIVGGSDNAISTVQIGNRLGVSVGLVNSEGTTLVYGQSGNDFNGSVVFQNAPRGTVITLD